MTEPPDAVIAAIRVGITQAVRDAYNEAHAEGEAAGVRKAKELRELVEAVQAVVVRLDAMLGRM